MGETRTALDHLGREINYPFPPQRIISLCPSITETLFAFGLKDRIVGRTRYCIHPEALIDEVKKVGGTKKVQADAIDELQPDLIIAEKEENPREIVETLSRKYPVFTAEVKTYSEALKMIDDLGKLTDRKVSAEKLAASIEEKFHGLDSVKKGKVAYIIWKNPYMAAGEDTYIHSLLARAGFSNVFEGRSKRYPATSLEELQTLEPDAILLASEPFPFQESHRRELQEQFPETKVMGVDGEICWYGSRMIRAAEELSRLQKVL